LSLSITHVLGRLVLERPHARGLRPLVARDDLALNPLVLAEALSAGCAFGVLAAVNEDVWSFVLGDEPIAFLVV